MRCTWSCTPKAASAPPAFWTSCATGQPQAALYQTIEATSDIRWLTWGIAALATFLLATWFITSSDSCTLVVATMLSLGDDQPPQRFRIVWGTAEGTVAAVLLLAGGLQALQAASIAAALPVSVILLAMTFGVIKSLAEDSSAAATVAKPEDPAAATAS